MSAGARVPRSAATYAGAGSGIGRGAAVRLAQEGAAVGVLDEARAGWLTHAYIAYRTVLHHISLEGQGDRVVEAAPYAETRARVTEIWRETFDAAA